MSDKNKLTTFVFTDRAGDNLLQRGHVFVTLEKFRQTPIIQGFEELVTAADYEIAIRYVEVMEQVEDAHLVAVPWGLVLGALAAKQASL